MNYKLSTQAKKKINLYQSIYSKTKEGVEGFILGSTIGDTYIVNDIFIINYNEESINSIYPFILNAFGTNTLGPIFIGKKKFYSDWFLEELVLEY